MNIREKYKLMKAKLRYQLRENELLSEEFASTQKKLKRLQTERKVLLEVLMAGQQQQQTDEVSDDVDDDLDVGSDQDIDDHDDDDVGSP